MHSNRSACLAALIYAMNQSGNVLFIILLAIGLLGALTFAIQGTGQQNGNIDRETTIIRVSEVRRYASELERGVHYILQNNYSESDIRFAHPNAHTDYGDLDSDSDKTDQVFDGEGGGAKYRPPPSGVNDGSAWEFYGHTAFAHVGSDEAELIAVLPNVTQAFCDAVNDSVGYDVQPEDSGTCVYGGATERFDASTQFFSSPNTTVEATFSVKPSLQGCVECTGDNSLHFYHVLLAR